MLDRSIPVAMGNAVDDLEPRPETVGDVDRQRLSRLKICGILVDKIGYRRIYKFRVQGGPLTGLLGRREYLCKSNVVSD